MSDVNETTPQVTGSTLVRNTNNTLVVTLTNHITAIDLQHLLKHLLMQIVLLRDSGKRVLLFVDTSKVVSADDNVQPVAIQFLQSDCDHIAIYSSVHRHRVDIDHMVKKLDRHDHIGIFSSEDEATAWVAQQEKLN